MATSRPKAIKGYWEGQKPPRMLLCHFSNDELKAFDTLQGGASFDENGIREYSALEKVIENPKIKELFYGIAKTFAKDMGAHGKPSQAMQQLSKKAKSVNLPIRESAQEEEPPLSTLEHKGKGGDTKVAWIPYNLAEILIDINGGEPAINSQTGLMMFGWFSKILGAVANVVAAVATGGMSLPAQMGIMAGVGAATSALQGGNPLKGAVIGGLTPGLGGLGTSLGMNAHLAQGLGRAGAGMLGGEKGRDAMMAGALHGAGHWGMGKLNEAGYIPSWLGGTPQAMGITTANTAGLGPAAIAGKQVADAALTQAPSGMMGGLGDMFSGASKYLLPAGMAALAFAGDKREHKKDTSDWEKAEAARKEHLAHEGYNLKWHPITPSQLKVRHHKDTINPPSWAMKRGIHPNPYLYPGDPGYAEGVEYAKGGHVHAHKRDKYNFVHNDTYHDQRKLQSPIEGVLIKGPGKGQQDLIKTTVPENCYIIDASTTGMFGDGSSDAGATVLKRFEEEIKERFPKKHTVKIHNHTQAKARQLPVWLSDSEYKFDPATVTILGKGDNAHGAAILKTMVKNIRSHKSSSGSGLPPKAKSPWDYLKGAA